jgi:cation:H+ antiporter
MVLGGRLFVTGAAEVARAWGIGELVIGLTVVAAGTSLPEAATSLVASFRGQRGMAVGNLVGSNVFNILGIAGIAATVSPMPVAWEALRLDLPVMTGVAVVCLPIVFTGYRIGRAEGALFLAGYVGYTA